MKKIIKKIFKSWNKIMSNCDDGLRTYCQNEYKKNADFVFKYVKKHKRFPY